MPRKGFLAAAIAALMAMSACAQRGEVDAERFDEHARAVAAAWSTTDQQERWRSSLVPLGSLTREPDWAGHDALMRGVRAGALDWVAEAVGDNAATNTVHYADGDAEDVTTLGARATLSELFDGGTAACTASCSAAVVTDAEPTTMELLTARGPATVPAWAFHLDGLTEPVLRVSVAGVHTLADIEPKVPGTERVQGLVPATALLAAPGNSVVVRLSTTDCSPASTPRVLETDTVVVVGATVHVPVRNGRRDCASVAVDRDVTVALSRPLGSRVLVTTGGRVVPPVGAEPPA